jgi:predicted glycoside hydrolase/deacetylase ChbG (UPF0249 family)
MMKYLIVNGDDFGASRGINRGIIEAHRHGILTSASLMVNTPFSEEAAKLAGELRHLSVGLHVDLPKEPGGSPERARDELQKQFGRFVELMGGAPTHLDSHHNVHRNPQLHPHFVELAAEHGLPLREHSPVRYFSTFYGQWGGESHLEHISAASLAHMLETGIGEGFTELSCHPGYVDADHTGSYSVEREAELRTLCDPAIRRALATRSIQLVSYHDLGPLQAAVVA